jgi:AcrR family transcriptional regulator
MSTPVKQPAAKDVRDTRAAQGAATRASLIEVARELFGSRGFVDTSLDDVVAGAQVTKGALYHHFRGKEDLFAAVYEVVLREVSDRVVTEFLREDAWEALLLGCELWIDAHLDPAVQRIVMRDARSALGWETVRDFEARYGVVPLRGALRRAIRQGVIESHPLRPLALMIMGALNEACFYVVDCDDPDAARAEISALIVELLSGLTTATGRQDTS